MTVEWQDGGDRNRSMEMCVGEYWLKQFIAAVCENMSFCPDIRQFFTIASKASASYSKSMAV